MTGAEKLIKDFYGKECKMFYTNAHTGTWMVEVVEGSFRQLVDYPVLVLAKRIMDYKRRLAKGLPY